MSRPRGRTSPPDLFETPSGQPRYLGPATIPHTPTPTVNTSVVSSRLQQSAIPPIPSGTRFNPVNLDSPSPGPRPDRPTHGRAISLPGSSQSDLHRLEPALSRGRHTPRESREGPMESPPFVGQRDLILSTPCPNPRQSRQPGQPGQVSGGLGCAHGPESPVASSRRPV